MEERIILHVDMNAFFASVEQQACPALRGRPISVGGNPGSRTVVAAASYEAKAYGIKNGMSLPEARELCPDLIAVEGNPMKYVDTSMKIFRLMRDFTPDVEIFSIDEAFLDVTGTCSRFGTPEDLARMIKERILHRFGLRCSVGIGPNKMISKLAANMQKPDGLVRIKPGDVSRVLERLPVEKLCGIGEKMKEHLWQMGVTTCGQLGRVPVERLVKRFGLVAGEYLHELGCGMDRSRVHPYFESAPVKSVGHSRTLGRDTRDPAVVRATLLALSEQVGRRMRRDGLQGRTVMLVLRYGDFSSFARQKSMRECIDDGYGVYRVALGILGSAPAGSRPVRLVGVSVSNLVENARQLTLFEEDRLEKRLLEALDEVNDRWGEFTVARASVMAASSTAFRTPTHGFLYRREQSGGRPAPRVMEGPVSTARNLRG